MMTHPEPQRGDIWLIQFDPKVGSEIGKVRPAVVISSDGVGRLPLRIVVPITDWQPRYQNYAWFVHIANTQTNGLSKDSGADAFQVKSLAIDRFVSQLGVLTEPQMENITAAVALCIGYRP